MCAFQTNIGMVTMRAFTSSSTAKPDGSISPASSSRSRNAASPALHSKGRARPARQTATVSVIQASTRQRLRKSRVAGRSRASRNALESPPMSSRLASRQSRRPAAPQARTPARTRLKTRAWVSSTRLASNRSRAARWSSKATGLPATSSCRSTRDARRCRPAKWYGRHGLDAKWRSAGHVVEIDLEGCAAAQG